MAWLGQPWEKGNVDFTLLDWHEGLADPVSQATILDATMPLYDHLQHAEADGDHMEYVGLMLLQTSTVSLLLSSAMGCTALLSDDSSALSGILPQNLLNDEQDNLDYEACWDWVTQNTDLPRPEDHPDFRLFRVRIAAPPAVPDAVINFPPGVDAWDALDHLVTLWPDLTSDGEQSLSTLLSDLDLRQMLIPRLTSLSRKMSVMLDPSAMCLWRPTTIHTPLLQLMRQHVGSLRA